MIKTKHFRNIIHSCLQIRSKFVFHLNKTSFYNSLNDSQYLNFYIGKLKNAIHHNYKMSEKINYSDNYVFRAYMRVRKLGDDLDDVTSFFGERGFMIKQRAEGKSWFRLSSLHGIVLNDTITYSERGVKKDLSEKFIGIENHLKYCLNTSLHDPIQALQITDKEWHSIRKNLDKEFSQKFIFYPESLLLLPDKKLFTR